MVNIGARIRELRRRRGVSQGEIARKIGTAMCCLSRIENGVYYPTIGMIERIADALDVPARVLLAPDLEWQRRLPAPETSFWLHFMASWRRLTMKQKYELRDWIVAQSRRMPTHRRPWQYLSAEEQTMIRAGLARQFGASGMRRG